MKNNKSKLNEEAFRALIRKEIKRVLEAEEAETEEKPEEEAPKEEPQPEGLDPVLEEATMVFIKKLKQSGVSIDPEALVDIVADVVDAFMSSSDQKLMVLKSVKSKIVH